MKKTIKLFSLLAIIVACLSLASCKGKGEKYVLTEITGIEGFSANMYDYNYIILYKNGTYEIENKANGIVTSQSGRYKISGDQIKFTTRSGCTQVKEVYDYDKENGTITITTTIYELELKMVLTKEQ